MFDGPINGKKFRAYVGQILVPTLGAGDLEVMDNLASHEVASIGQAIEGVGAEGGFLPPYSPHLEPIEPVLAKVKKQAAKNGATDRQRLKCGPRRPRRRLPAERLKYFRNAGYVRA